jgi:hypothetical protein
MRHLTLAVSALVFAFGLNFSLNLQARELDNEKTVSTEQVQLGQSLPKTVVIRTKAGTNQKEVLHSSAVLSKDNGTKLLVSTSSFVKLDKQGKMAGELDNDSSSSSWYFNCCSSGYYPQYYYGGYQYSYVAYYSYYYAGYNYSYYGWPYCNPYSHYAY